MKLIFEQKIHTKPDESIRNLQGDFNVTTFLDPVVSKQYITEYQTKRKNKLGTVIGYLGDKISYVFGGANTLDIDTTCKSFKKSFVEKTTPKDRIETLLTMGRTSWISQDLKLSKNLPYLMQPFAHLFTESASEYSKNLSAIIKDWLTQINDPQILPDPQEQAYKLQVRAELYAQLAQLEGVSEKAKQAWYKAIKGKQSIENIKNLQAEYDASIRDLAYLGDDFHVLTSGRLQELFPGVEFTVESNAKGLGSELNRGNQHEPNPHIPNILQPIYAEMYMKSELSHRLGDDATVEGFIKLARKEFEAENKAGKVNLSDAANNQQTSHTASTPGSQSHQEMKYTPIGSTTPQNSTLGGNAMNTQASTPITTMHTHLKIDTSSPGIMPRQQSIETLPPPDIQLNTAVDLPDELSDLDDSFEEGKALTLQPKSSTASLLASLGQAATAPVSEPTDEHAHGRTNNIASVLASTQSSVKPVAAPLPTNAVKTKGNLMYKKQAKDELKRLKKEQEQQARQSHDALQPAANKM
jgi:hypothetical protein